MEELSIEAKAKRYDKAIEIAKSKIRNDKNHVLYEDDVIEIFPELKESEDERLRKTTIAILKLYADKGYESAVECIDWLERQSEQKSVEWHIEDEQNLNACLGHIPDEFLRRWLKDVIHTKYDKPIDRVEPKFHKGE